MSGFIYVVCSANNMQSVFHYLLCKAGICCLEY